MIRALLGLLAAFVVHFATAESNAEPGRLLVAVGHREGLAGEPPGDVPPSRTRKRPRPLSGSRPSFGSECEGGDLNPYGFTR